MRQYTHYGFPEIVLEPGEEREASVQIKKVFKAEKFFMSGFMEPIRGNFWVKRSRLPRLNRDCVTAYSKVSKYPKRRRTIVEYHSEEKNFTRTYLPSSVVYNHVDPLSYITMHKLQCDEEQALATSSGISTLYFGKDQLGNGLPLPTSQVSINMALKNSGDVQVRVFAAVHGVEWYSGTVESAAWLKSLT